MYQPWGRIRKKEKNRWDGLEFEKEGGICTRKLRFRRTIQMFEAADKRNNLGIQDNPTLPTHLHFDVPFQTSLHALN